MNNFTYDLLEFFFRGLWCSVPWNDDVFTIILHLVKGYPSLAKCPLHAARIPLAAACKTDAIPHCAISVSQRVELVSALIEAYPGGTKRRCGWNLLPIHYCMWHRVGTTSDNPWYPEVIACVLEADPECAVALADGMDPVEWVKKDLQAHVYYSLQDELDPLFSRARLRIFLRKFWESHKEVMCLLFGTCPSDFPAQDFYSLTTVPSDLQKEIFVHLALLHWREISRDYGS